MKKYIVEDSKGAFVDIIYEDDSYYMQKYRLSVDQYGGFYRLIPVNFL